MPFRFLLILFLCHVAGPAAADELLHAIRADSLKGNISFLASDLLEGRDTPSRGLEIAEEYIAAQFRRIGLEPAGDAGSYFQNAPFLKVTQPMDGFRIRFAGPDGKVWESSGLNAMPIARAAMDASWQSVVKVSIKDGTTALPSKEEIAGKAVVLYVSQMSAKARAQRDALLAMGPAIVLTPGVLFNQRAHLRPAGESVSPTAAVVITSDRDFAKIAGDLPDGATDAQLSVQIPAPVEERVGLRNVLGRLPGSDPALKEQHILLTAHHDHLGIAPRGDGDRILNGANDDASGVATVIALAEAFSGVKAGPKRTLVFMTYFGEEKGLIGSRYYASHPVFPLKATVANLNFEQMGRTDDSEGPRVGKMNATGFDYTTIGAVLAASGKATGVKANKHKKNSDAFFARSDNQALADVGVPAITVSATYLFADYHRPGDHWEKIDYANMERLVRTVALTVSRLADDAEVPRWVDTKAQAEKYVKAYRKLHGVIE